MRRFALAALVGLALAPAVPAGAGGGCHRMGATGAGPAGGKAVTIVACSFEPAVITVAPGTTVTWTNKDPVPHTVTSSTQLFNGILDDQGALFSWTFADPGTFAYVCAYHPGMAGTVVVGDGTPQVASPVAARSGSGADGGDGVQIALAAVLGALLGAALTGTLGRIRRRNAAS